MIVLLSPSKTLDFETKPAIATHTQPQFLADSKKLIKELRRYSPAELSSLMEISDKLAQLNAGRYRAFKTPFTPANARQALLAFKGDVYEGLDVATYDKGDFTFAQNHIRILSGLYGLLRPLDLIQPYRLEMGISLPNPAGKDLYRFWNERITQAINAEKPKLVVNLASQEYFKSVRTELLAAPLLNVAFKENQKGTVKIVALFAKRARGAMASFIVRNRLSDKKEIKHFNEGGYRFDPALSGSDSYVFVR